MPAISEIIFLGRRRCKRRKAYDSLLLDSLPADLGEIVLSAHLTSRQVLATLHHVQALIDNATRLAVFILVRVGA